MVRWLLRLGVLVVLFLVCFVIGSMPVAFALPDFAKTEPGLVSPEAGLLIIAFVNVAVVAALILTSRWSGWKLAIGLGLAYYGAVTVLPQVETWFFLTTISVTRRLLAALFFMGVPTAVLFVPLAVWILGKGRGSGPTPAARVLQMPAGQWLWRSSALAVAYVVLYWTAGYFIAWQNPELRAFYGHSGDALPFFEHTANTFRSDPSVFYFQIVRGLLWVLCAVPIMMGSGVGRWPTALLVGALFSLPQNAGQILANPLMPLASVRHSHMVETASSTFLFGLLVVWLLYKVKHET